MMKNVIIISTLHKTYSIIFVRFWKRASTKYFGFEFAKGNIPRPTK